MGGPDRQAAVESMNVYIKLVRSIGGLRSNNQGLDSYKAAEI